MTDPKLPPDVDKLMNFAVDMALNYLPKLGIPREHHESALKAYVAGFFAGKGAARGEEHGKPPLN